MNAALKRLRFGSWRETYVESFWHAARATYASDSGLPKLPSFELRDLAGNLVRSSELARDMPAILVVSSPHCKPCEMLYPAIQAHSARHSDVRFVLLSRAARQRNQALSVAHRLDDVLILGSRKTAETALGVTGTPFAVLVSSDGFVFWRGLVMENLLAGLVETARHPLVASRVGREER
jgi:hypothetical protein